MNPMNQMKDFLNKKTLQYTAAARNNTPDCNTCKWRNSQSLAEECHNCTNYNNYESEE